MAGPADTPHKRYEKFVKYGKNGGIYDKIH